MSGEAKVVHGLFDGVARDPCVEELSGNNF